MNTILSPEQLRANCRAGAFTSHTSGLCRGFVQCNLVILPKDWADEFHQFAMQNPKPCPLVHVVETPGQAVFDLAGHNIDIRTDLPQYRVWRHGELVSEVHDIGSVWQDDFVTFLIGCSFSFEEALEDDGLEIRNITEQKNVPMYNTNIPCNPTERFYGNMVVSMRPFVARDAIRMIEICSRFPRVHGAPVHLGDPNLIGIGNLQQPDYGDAVSVREQELPVFTACGVTPQVILQKAKPPISITHSPGSMLVTDIPNADMVLGSLS